MRKYVLFMLAASLLLFASGCASTREMAKVINSAKAEGQFFAEEGRSKYNFYYYAEGSTPIAYLALDKKYQLQSEFWYEIAMSAGAWRDALNDRPFPFDEYDPYRAKEIISSESETIGFVLSRYYWITAWFNEPGSTIITVPPPERSGLQRNPDRWHRHDR